MVFVQENGPFIAAMKRVEPSRANEATRIREVA